MPFHILGNSIFGVIAKHRRKDSKEYPDKFIRDIDIDVIKDILTIAMMYEQISSPNNTEIYPLFTNLSSNFNKFNNLAKSPSSYLGKQALSIRMELLSKNIIKEEYNI